MCVSREARPCFHTTYVERVESLTEKIYKREEKKTSAFKREQDEKERAREKALWLAVPNFVDAAAIATYYGL